MNKDQLFDQIDNNEIQTVFETLGKNKAVFSGYQDLRDRFIFDNPKGVELQQFKGALKAFISSKLAGEDNKAASRKGSPYYLTPIAATVPANFLGREKELTDIRNLLTRQNTIALVNAEGGMGKTTLAARYWQQYEHEYKNLAWLFCENGILAAMRNQLPEALHLNEAMNQYAADVEQQTRVIKTAMANLEKDCLLVLDNANEPDHISGFLHYMTGLGWHVLITSRCSKVLPDAGSEYKITGLPPDKARKLFKQYHDENTAAFDALLDHFLKAVGYNTLCIEIYSKNLGGGEGWGMTLETLLEKIEKNGLSLGDESFETIVDWVHNTQKVAVKSTDEVVEAIYDIAGLQQNNPDLHDLLITFALLPAESHSPAVLIPLLAPEDKAGLRRRLDQLTQKGWLATDNTSYRISPVVQKILLHRHADRLWELGEPIVTRLQDIFQAEGYHPNDIATAMLFADLVFVLADNLNTANDDIAVLFDRLWVYHYATGNLAKAVDAAEKMREVCEKNDDKNNLAISYEKLGSTHTLLGNLDKALTFFDIETKLFEELYEANQNNVSLKNGLAISYSKLGSTHTSLGNLDKALTFFEEYNRLEEELYGANPNNVRFKNGLAISYSKLGETQTELGNLDKALTFFEEYNSLEKELYEANPNNVSLKNGLAISYSKLGETHSELGNLDRALTFFEKAFQLIKELYEANPNNVSLKNGLAISYEKLGSTHTELGNLDKALTFFEERNRLSKELYEANQNNVSFKNGLAISYEKLGSTHIELGNLDKASTFFEEYNRLEKELYEANPNNVRFKNGLAISYEKLGSTHTELGNLDKALTFFEKALQLIKELYEDNPNNVSFKNGLAISYEKLGSTHTTLGNLDKGLTFFDIETKLFEELYEANQNNVSFKNGLAISYEKLGSTHTELGNLDKALSFYEERNRLGKELYEAYPTNVSFKNGLAISYYKLGDFAKEQLNDQNKASSYFQQAESLWVELVRDAPQYAMFQRYLSIAREILSEL